MKKAPSTHMIHSKNSKVRSEVKDEKQFQNTHILFGLFRSAVKKVVGVFTLFSVSQSRPIQATALPEPKSNTSQVKRNSCTVVYVGSNLLESAVSTDFASGSTWSSSKSSDLHVSSVATIDQLASVNFTINEIYKATGNFSARNIIGQGGFGTVYKGRLKNGSLVAVKRFIKNVYDRHCLMEFKNEVLALSKIEHLNLVKLYGYMEHKDERIIVVEFVGNGTLREHLDGTRGNGLDLAGRLDIAIDVAHAITYLHTYSDIPVIHRDIKASNILITEKLRAKVANFGFARMLTEDPGATHISTQIKGTAGYLDPEYLRTCQLTEKSDVYSFGVLLVELITGKHPIEPKKSEERVTARWAFIITVLTNMKAMQKLREGDIVMVMDPWLRRNSSSIMTVERVLKLAGKCLASSRQSRPSMKQCAEVLWRIRKEYKEMSLPSSSAAVYFHYSEDINLVNAKERQHMFLGIRDGENNKFVSA